MNQPVKRGEIGAENTQEIIRFAGHGKGADNLRLLRDHPGKAGRLLWAMGIEVNLYERLNRQPHPRRIKPGRIAGNITFCLKALAPAPSLTGRKIKNRAKILRRQMRVALQRGQQLFVCRIEHMRILRIVPA